MKMDSDDGLNVSEQRKSTIGVRMTILYAIIYSGFVVLSVFFPSLLGAKWIFGLNLAITYGLALILIAILFAIIYNMLVRMPNSIAASKPTPPTGKSED
jgi:uncharacterized membrane protein (DUF485 family)